MLPNWTATHPSSKKAWQSLTARLFVPFSSFYALTISHIVKPLIRTFLNHPNDAGNRKASLKAANSTKIPDFPPS
ncbi:hypothetical protein [Paenibacillus sp. MMO-177]|uniref:hypothetical protein n=1 Tax=Paenibacillus sp. MMO-177 TaxID=3081289 RepID=UPI003015A0E5